MKKLILLSVLSLIFFASCKQSTEPQPPEQKPPGYQEDISWPSLADSPWPTLRNNPQYTGRANVSGPTKGEIEKFYSSDSINLENGLVTTTAGNVLLASTRNDVKNFFSFTNSGTLNWALKIGGSSTTPVALREKICTIDLEGELYFFNGSGEMAKKLNLGLHLSPLGLMPDKEGNLYFCENHKLYKIDKEGNLSLLLTDDDFPYSRAVVSFSPDGNVIYIGGNSLTAYSITESKVLWKYPHPTLGTDPIVDSQNNLYVNTIVVENGKEKTAFVSFDKNGEVRWFKFHNYVGEEFGVQKYLGALPTIDNYGNVYFGYDTLFSINYLGKENWHIPLEGNTFTPLVCDNGNNIYLIERNSGNKLYKINKEGKIVFSVELPEDYIFSESPVLLQDKLLIPTWRGNAIFVCK